MTSFLDELGAGVKDQSHRPRQMRRVNIPKAGKPRHTRSLGIPALRNRVLISGKTVPRSNIRSTVLAGEFRVSPQAQGS
jgi:retron-type reverse transcriptase